MSGFLWYVCLGAISSAPAVYAIYSKRHVYKISTLIVFYMFTSSITWFGEFTVLGIFNSYSYKPGLYKDPWAENLVGHLILNTTMFPAAATLAVTYPLGYGLIFLIIAFFIIAEFLFVSVGLYEQHWWNYFMSIINIVIFLTIAKKWFHKITHAINMVTRTTTYYFVAFLIIHLPYPLLLLYGKQYYSFAMLNSIIRNIYRASTIFIYTYHIFEAFILVYFVCIHDKWYWKLAPFAISFLVQTILAKMNILTFQDGWNLLYLNLVNALCIGIFIIIEQYTLKTKRL